MTDPDTGDWEYPETPGKQAEQAMIDLKWTQRILDHWCKEYEVVLPTDFIAEEIYSTYSREVEVLRERLAADRRLHGAAEARVKDLEGKLWRSAGRNNNLVKVNAAAEAHADELAGALEIAKREMVAIELTHHGRPNLPATIRKARAALEQPVKGDGNG